MEKTSRKNTKGREKKSEKNVFESKPPSKESWKENGYREGGKPKIDRQKGEKIAGARELHHSPPHQGRAQS